MSTLPKHNQLHAMSAAESTSNKLSLSERLQDSLQVNPSLATSQSLSLNAQDAVTSIQNSSQRKFNPLTDAYSGIHEY